MSAAPEQASSVPPEMLSAAEIQHRASRGALWTALHVSVSLPLNVFVTAVTARALGVAGYGRLSYLIVVFAILQQATDFGFTSAVVQWGSAARAAGDLGTLRQHLSRATAFHVLAQAPLVVVATFVVLAKEGIVISCGFAAMSAVFLYASGASLALVLDQRNDLLARIALVCNVATQGAVLATVLLARSPIAVLFARAATSLLPALVALVVVRRPLLVAVLRPMSLKRLPNGFRAFALYSWGASLMALLVYSRSEILILEWVGSAKAVGLFSLAFGISQQMTGPVDAATAPLIPATAGLVSAHPDRVSEAVARAIRISALLAGILTSCAAPLVFALYSLVYGNSYRTSAWAFLGLAVVSTLQTALSPVNVLASALRLGRRMFLANLVALIVDSALAFGLIPLLSIWGAVIANAVGQVVALVMLIRAVSGARSGLRPATVVRALSPWWSALPAFALATFAVAALQSQWLGLVLVVPIGASLYVLFLRVGRAGITPADAQVLTRAVPLRLRSVALTLSQLVTTRGGTCGA